MKKIISMLLLLSLCLSFTACVKSEPKEISCEEIIAAYEGAGYDVLHNHDDPTYYDLKQYCNIKITDTVDPENNYLYVTRYYTEDDAKSAEKTLESHPVLWLFFGMMGEWRWLHTGCYGDFVYSTFNKKMINPLKELMK